MVGASGAAPCVVERPGIGIDGLGVNVDEPNAGVDGSGVEIGVPCACCAIVVRIN